MSHRPMRLAPSPAKGYTGYTRPVAKVMVSLPDDLLHEIDAEARRRGTTRSGLLRTFVDEALTRRSSRRAERIAEIMKEATPHGGNALELLRRERERR